MQTARPGGHAGSGGSCWADASMMLAMATTTNAKGLMMEHDLKPKQVQV